MMIIIIIIMFHTTFIFAYQALIHPYRNVKNKNCKTLTLIYRVTRKEVDTFNVM